MKTRLRIIASVALTLALTVPALAAGLWPTLPTVGGGSRCGGFATGTSGQVCVNTIPAGPTQVTGAEVVPADTNLANGQQPQTVGIPTALLQTNGTALVSGATTTYTVLPGIYNVVLTHSTTITSSTVTAPAAPIDGQRVRIGADHTVSTFAFAANTGQTLSVTTPTVLTASTTVPAGYEFIYVASTAKWYRLQ